MSCSRYQKWIKKKSKKVIRSQSKEDLEVDITIVVPPPQYSAQEKVLLKESVKVAGFILEKK